MAATFKVTRMDGMPSTVEKKMVLGIKKSKAIRGGTTIFFTNGNYKIVREAPEVIEKRVGRRCY